MLRSSSFAYSRNQGIVGVELFDGSRDVLACFLEPCAGKQRIMAASHKLTALSEPARHAAQHRYRQVHLRNCLGELESHLFAAKYPGQQNVVPASP